MLIFDCHAVGNKLLSHRKRAGLTQSEAAELAGLSDRTYADIERGGVDMRVSTLQKICAALRITPDEILTETAPNPEAHRREAMAKLDACTPEEKETALRLLLTYLNSL